MKGGLAASVVDDQQVGRHFTGSEIGDMLKCTVRADEPPNGGNEPTIGEGANLRLLAVACFGHFSWKQEGLGKSLRSGFNVVSSLLHQEATRLQMVSRRAETPWRCGAAS